MAFMMHPVCVDTASEDKEGMLVYSDTCLVAVLVRLSGEHDQLSGNWFLEHGFGSLQMPNPPTFSDLGAAQEWIAARITGR